MPISGYTSDTMEPTIDDFGRLSNAPQPQAQEPVPRMTRICWLVEGFQIW